MGQRPKNWGAEKANYLPPPKRNILKVCSMITHIKVLVSDIGSAIAKILLWL